jgi:hypothetical protein
VASPELAEELLERAFDLVQARCYRAVTRAWNSGRLAMPDASALPFQEEMDALLGLGEARAPERLERAEGLFWAAEDAYRLERSDGDGAWPIAILADKYALSPLAEEVLLAVVATGARPGLARAYAVLGDDARRPLCDEMLLCQLFAPEVGAREIAAELEAGAPLIGHGLLHRGDGDWAFAPRTAAAGVLARLRGVLSHEPRMCEPASPAGGFWLAAGAVASLERALAEPASPFRLLVRGRRGSVGEPSPR